MIKNVCKQIFNKYNALPLPVKASMWITFCSFLQQGINIVTVPIFSRILSVDDYGTVSLYNSWFDLIRIVSTFSIYCGFFNNGLIKYKSDMQSYISSMQGLSTLSGLFCLGLYLIFYESIEKLMGLPHILVITIFIQCIIFPSLSYWTLEQRFEYKYRVVLLITVLSSIMSPVISLISVSIADDKGTAKILGGLIVTLLIDFYFYIKIFKNGRVFYRKAYWKHAISFNLPLIPYFLSDVILNTSDRVMINYYCGISDTGKYGVAYNLAQMIKILNASIMASFIPWIYRKLEAGIIENIRARITALILFASGCIMGFILLTPEILLFFFGSKYSDVIYVIPPVAIGIFFLFLHEIFSAIERYYEKTVYIMAISIICSVLNIVLNAIMIPRFGYIAAAYTTLFSYIILCLLHYIGMAKACSQNGINLKMIINKNVLFTVSIIINLFSVCMTGLYHMNIIRYILILISIFVFLINIKPVITMAKKVIKN